MKRNTVNCYANRPYERTEKGLCYRIYYNQVRNSKARGHKIPTYTKEDLYDWITNQPNFTSIFLDWINSNFTSDLKPSCDRLDNSLPYTFSNIELVTWKVNKERAYADTTKGTLGSCQKPVYKYSLNGDFIAKYMSVNSAALSEEGMDHRNIATCCREQIPSAYGYFWSYRDLGNKIPAIKVSNNYDTTIYKYCPYTGDILDIVSTITDITTDTHKLTHLRLAIRTKKHWDFSYYSFSYLSPEEVISSYGIPKQKFIKVYKDGKYICTYPSANKAKEATQVADTTITKYCTTKQKHSLGYEFRFSFDSYD